MSYDAFHSHCASLELGGYSDWRLPNIAELRSLIRGCPATEVNGICNVKPYGGCLDYNCIDDSCDGCTFKEGPAGGCYWPDSMQGGCTEYWSGSEIDDERNPGYTWGVLFTNGSVGSSGDLGPVRCVRSSSGTLTESAPISVEAQTAAAIAQAAKKAAVDARAAKTWKDFKSGLTWQITPTGGEMSWSEAKTHCAGLSLEGGGWRLPTISELRSLIRGCPRAVTDGSCEVTDSCLTLDDCWSAAGCMGCSQRVDPAKDGCYWPDSMRWPDSAQGCGYYWSSSPVKDPGYLAWFVSFGYGSVRYHEVYPGRLARCVR